VCVLGRRPILAIHMPTHDLSRRRCAEVMRKMSEGCRRRRSYHELTPQWLASSQMQPSRSYNRPTAGFLRERKTSHTTHPPRSQNPVLAQVMEHTAGTRTFSFRSRQFCFENRLYRTYARRFDIAQHKKPGPPRTPGREPTTGEALRGLGQPAWPPHTPCGFLRAVRLPVLTGKFFFLDTRTASSAVPQRKGKRGGSQPLF